VAIDKPKGENAIPLRVKKFRKNPPNKAAIKTQSVIKFNFELTGVPISTYDN
jgi:hypothetical protein